MIRQYFTFQHDICLEYIGINFISCLSLFFNGIGLTAINDWLEHCNLQTCNLSAVEAHNDKAFFVFPLQFVCYFKMTYISQMSQNIYGTYFGLKQLKEQGQFKAQQVIYVYHSISGIRKYIINSKKMKCGKKKITSRYRYEIYVKYPLFLNAIASEIL